MKTILIALAALFALAPMADAAPSVMLPGKVCQLYGNYRFPNQARATFEANQKNDDHTQVVCGQSGPNKHRILGYRVEPYRFGTYSNNPIQFTNPANANENACFYVQNNSGDARSGKSYFVPAASYSDFMAFVQSANSNRALGIQFQPCTSRTAAAQEVAPSELCFGRLTTDAVYANGFQAISLGRAGEVRQYPIVGADGKLLRILTAKAGVNGWALSYDKACPTANTASGGVSVAIPAVFNAATSGTQRVFINDGALVRNIRG